MELISLGLCLWALMIAVLTIFFFPTEKQGDDADPLKARAPAPVTSRML